MPKQYQEIRPNMCDPSLLHKLGLIMSLNRPHGLICGSGRKEIKAKFKAVLLYVYVVTNLTK